jgi:hypothetical protein
MLKHTHTMKSFLLLISVILLFTSCDIEKTKSEYKGPPIIVQKQESVTGTCIYTYEGYGREEWFEDDCDKYSVGDTLKGSSTKK